jgi:hypothetical protein
VARPFETPFARWALALACLAGALLAACEDRGSNTPSASNEAAVTPVTPVEKPAGVPAEARTIVATERLGAIERQANQTPVTSDVRRLEDASCDEDVITMVTDRETIYALLRTAVEDDDVPPCDGFWDDAAKKLFVGKEVALVFEGGEERWRLLVEGVDGAQAEFTVGGIWVASL